MPNTSGHLSEWTLEQLAEGSLPEAEKTGAVAHLESCRRCEAELEAFRTLFVALAEVPRLAPSPGFADAVLARVRMAPAPSPWVVAMQRWLPSTRRGWAFFSLALLGPALPVVALVAWLFSQPLVSAPALWQWATLSLQEIGRAGLSATLAWGTEVGVVRWGQMAYTALTGIPAGTLAVVIIALAVAIPLSAWSLIRLIRTPMGNITYAN